jgi:leucyl aminopeptidase (aminopeptidase T)
MWERTVDIDYALLKERADKICAILGASDTVRVTAPGGTDITIGLKGRKGFADNGDFSFPGAGGNLPAGEAYVSPELGTASGVIVYDGSIVLAKGEILIKDPIHCTVEKGHVTKIEGGEEARLLLDSVTQAEKNAVSMEKEGKLPPGQGAIYAANARNIGELGIGLNPNAKITGKMLEDEKAFRTCHFAIGENYDDDAPCLIHLDGLVREPTITAVRNGRSGLIEDKGELKI